MRRHGEFLFPPPTSGWLANQNVLNPPIDSAAVLDNWFPTATGARMRRGASLHATTAQDVVRLLTYRSGSVARLIACGETAIYDITSPADPEVSPSASLSSKTSGDWSSVQISTAGGDFLVAVNGADTGWYLTGSTYTNYGGGTDIADGGATVDSTDMSHVNLYKERLFFVQGGTMTVWYLPVDSIAGTVVKLELGSVFRRGGEVLFTATWSVDSGSGLDDLFVAVSSAGEAAVFTGTDPSSASTWSLQGVYEVGTPLDKHSALKLGGELLIVTDLGIVPMSAAIRSDYAQLSQQAISFPIEDAWREYITRRSLSRALPFGIWRQEGLLLVGTEAKENNLEVNLVANLRTGAWCRYLNWDVRACTDLEDLFYFSDSLGRTFVGETGGKDAAQSYTATYVPSFNLCGVQELKYANHAQALLRSTVSANVGAAAFSDFQVGDLPAAPVLPEDPSASVWGTGVWGTSTWGGEGVKMSYTRWKTVRAHGLTLAPCFSVQSFSTAAPELEIMASKLRFEVGAPL